ncbi:hypothetical protein ACFSHT_10690 [Paraburkholderia silviterrae]|uniref:Uncharacterized protein n=1 Tax=Paraburkholderia silviterrae TaxID=2528715 RepID=A0A4R5ME85_9BURK|nr:hypothetical protein [Paraburkholderia silviterrae]TDG25416.1 hypothetical protein EYW47_06175 [Paraburkholderia silviterrae]
MTGPAHPGQRAIKAVKPLASSSGAAAFLLVFSFVVTPSTSCRISDPARVNVKEPIEKQANRHFQT